MTETLNRLPLIGDKAPEFKALTKDSDFGAFLDKYLQISCEPFFISSSLSVEYKQTSNPSIVVTY